MPHRIPALDITERVARANQDMPKDVSKKLQALNTFLSKAGDHGIDAAQAMHRIYKTMDYYLDRVAKPIAVCQRGCDHCCHIPVQVSSMEVAYIHDLYPEIPINKLVQPRLDALETNTACPLLANDGSCTVYDARPIHCRMFHSLDSPALCRGNNQRHHIITVESQPFFNYVLEQVQIISTSAPYAPIADIRDWFGGLGDHG